MTAESSGEWSFRNADLPLNRLGDLDAESFGPVVGKFLRLLTVFKRKHPCELKSAWLTKLRFDGVGDRFLLMLPFDWYVVYRVVPGCEAQSGIVEFLETDRMPPEPSTD